MQRSTGELSSILKKGLLQSWCFDFVNTSAGCYLYWVNPHKDCLSNSHSPALLSSQHSPGLATLPGVQGQLWSRVHPTLHTLRNGKLHDWKCTLEFVYICGLSEYMGIHGVVQYILSCYSHRYICSPRPIAVLTFRRVKCLVLVHSPYEICTVCN